MGNGVVGQLCARFVDDDGVLAAAKQAPCARKSYVQRQGSIDKGGEDDEVKHEAYFDDPLKIDEVEPKGAADEGHTDGNVGNGEENQVDVTRMWTTGSVTNLRDDDDDNDRVHREI